MRSSTEVCKLPASSSWTVSHDRANDASQVYACYKISISLGYMESVTNFTVSFALPFLLSAFRLSLILTLFFPLLLVASRSMDMSESEYTSIGSSCFDMFGEVRRGFGRDR